MEVGNSMYRKLFGLIILLLLLSQTVHTLAYASGGAVAPGLGTAGNFVIIGEQSIADYQTSGSVVGNIAIGPAAASFVTGLSLSLDSSGLFSTSSLVTGKIYAADYTAPTPTTVSTAVGDMLTAYNNAASGGYEGTPTVGLGSGLLGGITLPPGVYKWSTAVTISNSITLDAAGNSSAIWVFQIAQSLDVASGAQIVLAGGAQPQNIYWQVGTQAVLESNSNFSGTILAGTLVSLNDGTKLNGRALSQASVTLNGATGIVTAPTAATTTTTTTTMPTTTTTSTTTPTTSTSTTVATTTTTIPEIAASGGARSSLMILADNINGQTIQGDSGAPVLTAYIGGASAGGNFIKSQFYQNQLPVTLKLENNQVANISFACTFVVGDKTFTFTNNIYGVGSGAQCGKNYTTYGGSFAGIYTTPINQTVGVAAIGVPVVLPAPIAPVVIPVVLPMNNTVVANVVLPFPLLVNGFYEIPLGGVNIPATGMKPGIKYWITNKEFISNVNLWLLRSQIAAR